MTCLSSRYEKDRFVQEVHTDYVVWEETGRADYRYTATMTEVCRRDKLAVIIKKCQILLMCIRRFQWMWGATTRLSLVWINSVVKSLPSAFAHTQNAPVKLWRCQIKFHQRALNHKIFLRDSVYRNSIKTWESWPNSFNFQTIFILAISCIRRQETVLLPKYSLK